MLKDGTANALPDDALHPIQQFLSIRLNKQISEFRVTRTYLNLLVKPTIVFFPDFVEKCIISCILKRRNAFQDAFFQKNVCAFPV